MAQETNYNPTRNKKVFADDAGYGTNYHNMELYR